MTAPLDLHNIQGILLHGYKRLPYCNYLFLSIINSKNFSHWLETMPFQSAGEKPGAISYNIAFSAKGIKKMGVKVDESNGFSLDFIEGMNTAHKNRTLGDTLKNCPEYWYWGSDEKPVDCLLMVFAESKDVLDTHDASITSTYQKNGLEEVHRVYSTFLNDGKEHFGFRDGLQQPGIKGFSKGAAENNLVNPGEFILGYPNTYEKLPLCPRVDDFSWGKNGTYMVVRQLAQHVKFFWDTLLKMENNDMDKAIILASKMVGRWPNGKPLVLADNPDTEVGSLTDFTFHEADKAGHKCPIGSHIRRANPRDGLDDDPEDSLELSNAHRILRRGRSYGPALSADMDIPHIIQTEQDDIERGLMFICFNTDIARQFEFVQHTWINNKKFSGLYNDLDPISGTQIRENEKTQFEVQACPYRKRYTDIPEFISVKGGEYFFLPAIESIRHLATIGKE